MHSLIGAAGRDIDSDVAQQADTALRGVAAKRGPLAVEAHLILDRARTCDSLPIADPVPLALAELIEPFAGNPRPRRAEKSGPRGERRPCLVRRPPAIGRAERQHLPPGNDVMWSWTPLERGS